MVQDFFLFLGCFSFVASESSFFVGQTFWSSLSFFVGMLTFGCLTPNEPELIDSAPNRSRDLKPVSNRFDLIQTGLGPFLPVNRFLNENRSLDCNSKPVKNKNQFIDNKRLIFHYNYINIVL
ncbi:unnamed protein product [Rhizophagus irregularis]|nr:unnamed protein product [Rhizophagus irregularis]CAB4443820.1 unnamed protein product [Rhizophagus irregularis]